MHDTQEVTSSSLVRPTSSELGKASWLLVFDPSQRSPGVSVGGLTRVHAALVRQCRCCRRAALISLQA